MIKNMITGSKGGSSKPHTPVEMEDNLISINRIRILLAVSDGEVDPDFSLKDLYFDDVPVMNQDGSLNFQNVKAEFRPGTQTQDYIQGFTDTASEITVARDLTAATPYIISVTNKNLSAIRIKILMPRGFTQEDNGDLTGVRVEYAVDMAVDGAEYKEVLYDVIEGKTMSGYDRSRRIDLPDFNERVLLRVRRLTDSTSARVTDLIKMQSYAEVVDAKFRYPLTGLVYVEFDSELFPNALPNISIKKKWKIINVPSNYDPISRTYSGSWDGTWKKAWSNNPAFVLYDLITNQRYGLDQRELGIALDKWSIYECAQYCDQMVPDGKGGTEPRYLCDVVIQSQVEAYQLVRDICSIFRGMSFWNGESLSIVIDKPRDASYIFTNDNVVNGEFTYTFASEKSMYTQCNVTFDDEQNMYQQDVEGVFETEAALRFGYNSTSITAIGCTRRSEANRRGRWILKTNVKSTTVNFATGLEGMIPTVGDVIVVSDNFWSSALTLNLSGRLMEVNGLQVFTPFKVDARAGDRILVNKPDGKPVGRTIARVSDDGKTLTLNTTFGFDVQPDTIFAIERTDIAQQRYVVTGITKGDGDEEFTYNITAVEYDPNKYDEIDYGVNIDDRPTSIVQPDILPAPQNVKIESYSRVVQGASVETMHVSWDKVEYASLYEMQWRKDNGNWNNTPRTANKETEVEGIYAGNYHVRVRSVAANGSASGWSAIVSAGLTGKVGEPEKPINLTASDNEVFGIRVKWGMPEGSGDTAYIELHQAPNGADGHPIVDEATLLTLVPFPQYEYWHSILPAGHVVWYKARAVDKIGNVSDWTDFVRGMASDDTSIITDHIKVDIENSDGYKWLQENAIKANDKIHSTAESVIENALANDKDVRRMRVENGKRKAEFLQSLKLIADETEARVTQVTQMSAQFDEKLTAQNSELREVIANSTETISQRIDQLTATFESEIDGVKQDIKAQITDVNQAITNEAEARASADRALSTQIGDTQSAVNQKLDSWVNGTSVGAMYGVKLGIRYNGQEYSAGMALSLVADGSGVKSQFLFDAGRFAIINNAQSGGFTLPFVVENNQVFINSLLVKNGSIGNAQIADQINSNNWSSGAAGWMINKNGYAEFNQITVRGTVYANAGSFTGNVYATDGWFRGTVYAEKIEGDVAKAVVLGFNGSVHIPAVNYNRHLVIPYVGIHGYTYSGGTWGGGTVWVDSTYGGRLANVQATAMHGGSSGYVLLPAGNATTLSYGGNLNHANAVPILTVLLFKA
ncbi:putative tail fiber protein [Citrobacter phage vB_CfrD_BlueShadow]|uniref:Tail fiber protein n=2 Tax=Tlsvirus sazh TaxID=2734009 RepID=A0AC61TQ94_9CAUD|nr:putative tail fiber protein [Citrobacter phage vB_CfrD_ZerotoHero]UGO53664.1 putative tail fiber protein [Citrobacter phage vB_CfrD_BlueShadow]UGO53834.1 tail fiber protein [Citrobacter phage vB_CfrD_Reinasaurus]